MLFGFDTKGIGLTDKIGVNARDIILFSDRDPLDLIRQRVENLLWLTVGGVTSLYIRLLARSSKYTPNPSQGTWSKLFRVLICINFVPLSVVFVST